MHDDGAQPYPLYPRPTLAIRSLAVRPRVVHREHMVDRGGILFAHVRVHLLREPILVTQA